MSNRVWILTGVALVTASAFLAIGLVYAFVEYVIKGLFAGL